MNNDIYWYVFERDECGDPVVWACSNCNEPYMFYEGTPLDHNYNYCPNCGSKMSDKLDEDANTILRQCSNCPFNDGLVYTSFPPKYKCTITDEFHLGEYICDVRD